MELDDSHEVEVFSIQVENSDFREGFKRLLIPGFIDTPNLHVKMFEDLEIWVHEFSEMAVRDCLRNNGFSRFNRDVVGCSLFGVHKRLSLAHLLVSLHAISYRQVKKRLRKKSIRLSAEDFTNNILIWRQTHGKTD
jgi:hypothetical protein